MPTLPRRTAVLAVLVLAIFAIGDTRLGACSCAGRSSPCQSASAADLVFAGKVDGIEKLAAAVGPRPILYDRRVRLHVLEQFTGQAATEVDIFTHQQSATCGYPFAVGGTYLVYAYRHQDSGLLTTSICSRTSPLGLNADVRYLRGLRALESTALLKGTVLRAPINGKRVPVSGAKVGLEPVGANTARRHSTVTGANGRFEVQAPMGQYRLSVALPADLWTADGAVTLLDPRGCRDLAIVAQPNGRINGRVLDARGTAVPFLPIDAMRPSDARARFATPISSGFTDDAGVFEIARVPPGTYALGLHLSRLDNQQTGWFWFPAGRAETATTVTLGSGERISSHEVVLPAEVVPVLIQGSIADPTGQPLADANVIVSINDGWSWHGVNAVTLDAAGRFRLSLIDGRRYRLRFSKAFGAIYKQIDVPEFVAARDLPSFDLRFDR